MKTYIFTIITISIVSGIVTSMLSSNSTLKKHINFVSGLICAITLLSPVASIVKNTTLISENINNIVSNFDINESTDKGNKIIVNEGIAQISNGVKNAVVSKFNLSDKDIVVDIIVNDENIEAIMLEKIIITLYATATWSNGDDIKEYVQNIVGCTVTVIKK